MAGESGSTTLPETFDRLCAKIDADMAQAKGERFAFMLTPVATVALNQLHIVAALNAHYATMGWKAVVVEMAESPHYGRIVCTK